MANKNNGLYLRVGGNITMKKTLFYTFKIILLLVAIGSYISLNTHAVTIDNGAIINLVIAINGVLIAVITTFLFSKISSERAERIQKKREIDALGTQVTSLRRIARTLSLSHTFWIRSTTDIRRLYPDLCVFSMRKFTYDQYTEFLQSTNLSELTAQAFLSTRFLEGEDGDQLTIDQNYRKNYDLESLGSYHECCSFIYSYTEEYSDQISLREWDINRLQPEVSNISNKRQDITPKSLGELISSFSTEEIEKLFTLTSENLRSIGQLYKWIFTNLSFSFILLMYSLISTIYQNLLEPNIPLLILGTSWLIADLILNTFFAMRDEILITDFYR